VSEPGDGEVSRGRPLPPHPPSLGFASAIGRRFAPAVLGVKNANAKRIRYAPSPTKGEGK
jgi:hypothetical protein